jgi:2-polyprenyl-6-methoxyphenol hydroxylase-like FAD-dependent oxidoreductase
MLAIVGGGVAGLTLANVLLALGYDDFCIYERQATIAAHMDYALTIQQAANVLRFLGIDFPDEQKAQLTTMAVLDFSLTYRAHWRHTNGNYAVPRSALLRALAAKIPTRHFRLGHDVTALNQLTKDGGGAEVEVVSSSGGVSSHERMDLVVVCDGIRSKLRDALIGGGGSEGGGAQPCPVRNEVCALKLGLLKGPHPLVTRDTVFQLLSPVRAPSQLRTRVFIKPYDAEHCMVQVVGTTTDDVPDVIRDLWLDGSTTRRDHLLTLAPFDPPQSSATRILLLGDALHGMTPYKGQGANVSMMAAFTLAKMIATRAAATGATSAAPQSQFEGVAAEHYAEVLPFARKMQAASREKYVDMHTEVNDARAFNRSTRRIEHMGSWASSSSESAASGSGGGSIVCEAPTLGHPSPCTYRWSTNGKSLHTIQLSGVGLTEVPAMLRASAGTLTSLTLTNNRITELPSFIGEFRWLTKLHLRSNLLTDVPAELFDLVNLTTLRLSCNQLTAVSAGIGKFARLRELCLSGNRLRALPSFRTLARLRVLYAANNLFGDGDGDADGLASAELHTLPALRTMRIQGNPLSTISTSILPPDLRELRYNVGMSIVKDDADDACVHSFRQDVVY